MMLNDKQIKAECELGVIEPYNPANVGPCSLDLTLGKNIAYYQGNTAIDPAKHSTYNLKNENMPKTGYILEPGEFILAETVEKITLPRYLAGKVDGRSSMGRLGIAVHITAGFIDAGFSGTITLEIHNVNRRPVILRPGMIVAQMCFFEIDPCERDYQEKGGRYQNERGATGSRYYQVIG